MDSSSKSSPGIGTVLVGVVAGVALGVAVSKLTAPATPSGGSTGMLAATTLTDACHAKSDHTIQVAADGTLDCPDVVIGALYQVRWITATGTLKITFRQPAIFPNSNCSNGTTNNCSSGTPVITWNPGEDQRNCDYTGTLSTSTSSIPIAGRIIIVKP